MERLRTRITRTTARYGDDPPQRMTADTLGRIDRLIIDLQGVLAEVSYRMQPADTASIESTFSARSKELVQLLEAQLDALRSCIEDGDPESVPCGVYVSTSILKLSSRETEVGLFVTNGFTNQQIARRMAISHKTVETYVARIFKKLGVSSRAEVARTFGRYEAGLVRRHPLESLSG